MQFSHEECTLDPVHAQNMYTGTWRWDTWPSTRPEYVHWYKEMGYVTHYTHRMCTLVTWYSILDSVHTQDAYICTWILYTWLCTHRIGDLLLQLVSGFLRKKKQTNLYIKNYITFLKNTFKCSNTRVLYLHESYLINEALTYYIDFTSS